MIRLQTAFSVPEGDGITVKRLMPVAGLMNFDPFVLWDHFDIAAGGFPTHPHRGFEAITWMFAGGMQHKDNLGNEGTVHAGGAQRFTAGRGIMHSEMPQGHAAGIQLWINLPHRLKQIEPEYQQVEAEEVSVSESDGARLLHIVGKAGAIRLHTDVEYLDITLSAGSRMQRHIMRGWRGIIYIVEGAAELVAEEKTASLPLHAGDAALVESEDLLSLYSPEGVHLMWCVGAPHHEPIHQHGPYVD
jgi:quercetin 2,3-dioxygenase